MHALVQAFYFSISTMIMNVPVHGARCPNVLVCSSVLFAGRRVRDVIDFHPYPHKESIVKRKKKTLEFFPEWTEI